MNRDGVGGTGSVDQEATSLQDGRKGVLSLFRALALAYPLRTAVVFGLLVLAGLSEGFGIAGLLPLLGILLGDGASAAGPLAHRVRAVLGMVDLEPTLSVLLFVIVAALALKSALYLLAMTAGGFSAAHLERDLRVSLVRALFKARWSHFLSLPTGTLANAVTTEASRSSHAYILMCTLMSDLVVVAVYGALALLISWQVTLAAATCGLAIFLLLKGLIRVAREAGVKVTDSLNALSGGLVDGIRVIKTLKAMACEQLLAPFIARESETLKQAERLYWLSTHGLVALQEPLMVVVLAAGLYASVTIWQVPFENIMILGLLFWRTTSRINVLQRNYQNILVFESAFWSLRDLFHKAEEAEETVGAGNPPTLNQGIRLERVSFAHDNSGPVFKDITLTIRVGRFTAIAGPSGSGKSTLANLVVGLFRPQAGRVLIDSVPLEELDLSAWRGMIGYVPQEVILFHDTVHANVTLGDPALTRDDAEAALKAAGAWDFVSGLEAGMDTLVGERGTKLSGGQRQRIAIARALVRKPRLLILDEVTTALDPLTEEAICKTLKDLSGRITILAVSHQPALVEAADQVYRLQHP
ncbi:MAG: ABC transporter ATP-binding protein [Thermodesulfobacteriota bacterium]